MTVDLVGLAGTVRSSVAGATYGGAILVEGTWYSPSMPKLLIDATEDYRNHLIDEATYKQRLAARDPYRLVANGDFDADGFRRWFAPCSAPSPPSCAR